MLDNLRFIDATERLTRTAKKYTKQGSLKTRLIKLTSSSQKAFKRAVEKRLAASIFNLESNKKVLEQEYQDTYAELETGLKQSIVDKKGDVDHLMEQFNYLTELSVNLVDTDRKLKTLNDRLVIHNKKAFNLKGDTFKRVVANVTVLKNSVLDKYANKRIVTSAYEDSIQEIDELMSKGRYYTAEQTIKKMTDYNSMALGASTSGITGDIYSNPDINENSVDDNLQEESFDTDSDLMVDIVPVEELDKKIFSTIEPIPASFEEIKEEKETNSNEVNDENLKINSSDANPFGIDFTKLIKKSVETQPEEVTNEREVQSVAESEKVSEEVSDDFDKSSEIDLEQIVADRLPDANTLAATELGIDIGAQTQEEQTLLPEQEVVEELQESISDNEPKFSDLAAELGIDFEAQTIEEPKTQQTIEEPVSAKPSKEINGQIGFDNIDMSSSLNIDQNETLIPEISAPALSEVFRNLDDYKNEVANDTSAFLADMDSQVEKTISEIEFQTQSAMNDSLDVAPEPIVTSSEEEVVSEKAVIDGEQVELNHELLKKMYDILNYKDKKIAELEAYINNMEQAQYDAEPFEETKGKKM